MDGNVTIGVWLDEYVLKLSYVYDALRIKIIIYLIIR